ncbi:nitric oxide synthase oxygenase [Actinomadura kijaniata]|uniref:Nitric-oxide synthase n=1 Tax=Actinomadura namibiensis TaxID=182080 RepID=A0A7W3QNR1_ACTNM|nr:nitric oxide synthase oxygenase [Actinomadura namibiensis]MBA8953905.1 nitric-oxide synthase [Actinomadura namibiensis]
MSLFGRKTRARAVRPVAADGIPAGASADVPAEGAVRRAAEEFLRMFHAEDRRSGDLEERLRRVRAEIAETGTYRHTEAELTFGARVAWRNSDRCIGRLYWRSLRVRDLRHARAPEEVAAGCVEHLAAATGGGRIRPIITVFAPDGPGRPGPRLWNSQLIRYAGYRRPDGVVGDPANVALTAAALALGWPGGAGTRFDVLPLVVEVPGEPVRVFDLPPEVVLEVPLAHPDFPWFERLGLRWHAVPAVSDMTLEIGGVTYPAAPFNGWYMGTEIGARNLADTDRYDLLSEIADLLGLDRSEEATLWRDRALVELNVAVLHSFRAAAVTVTDHHTEARRFLIHLAREEAAGRVCPADWSWIVPPISGAATPVFHRYYDEADLRPAYVRRPEPEALRRAVSGPGGAHGAVPVPPSPAVGGGRCPVTAARRRAG